MRQVSLVISFFAGLVLTWAIYRKANHYRPRAENVPTHMPRFDYFSWTSLYWGLRTLYYALMDRDLFLACAGNLLILAAGVGLILLLLPLLRKFLQAESCATVWGILAIMLPVSGVFPRWIIPLPFSPPGRQLKFALLWIWLAGFVTVMLWSILSHLRYRKRLLRNAKPVEDEIYRRVWEKQLLIANLPAEKIRFCISPDTRSPLSIGLYSRTTCLVLPQQSYTQEELKFVLQHELVHISRKDSQMKFAMCFYTALMWFNPLVWIAMRMCAQDLELSCDETVLYGHSEETRMKYARLLLQTAPNSRGFTTCLSSSAKSLRYRLKRAVTNQKQIVGGLVIGALCVLMVMGSMSIGFWYRPMSTEQLLFTKEELNQMEITDMFLLIDNEEVVGSCEQPQLLREYIAGLSLSETSQRVDITGGPNHMQIRFDGTDVYYVLNFEGNYLRVIKGMEKGSSFQRSISFYQLRRPVDWELLRSCVTGH